MARRVILVGLAAPMWACAALLGIDDGIPREGGTDAPSDALVRPEVEAGPCNLSAPFQAPVPLSSLDTPAFAAPARLLPDELTVFFERVDVDAGDDLYVATRGMLLGKFGAPSPITELDMLGADQGDPTTSPDALDVVFASNRAGGLGANDIWQATRDASTSPFGTISPTPNINSTQDDVHTYYVPGALYFASNRTSAYHIYRAAQLSGGFASPISIPELSSQAVDWGPVVTTDELRIYFSSTRADSGTFDVYTSTRMTSSQPWTAPTLVTELAGFGNTIPSWISPDGCRLYLSSDHSGNEDMYMASK